MKKILLLLSAFLIFSPLSTQAQELHQDLQGIWRAEVQKVIKEEIIEIPGTETKAQVQTIEAKILEGERSGDIVTLQNDYIPLKAGDEFYLNYLITVEGTEIFSVRDVNRIPVLAWIVLLFFVAVILLAGWQGVRSLIGLLGTLFVIVFVLLPLLLKGYPPVLTSTLIAVAVLFIAIYLTHGFNRESTVAFLGTVLAVSLTSVLAFFAVGMARMTGFSSDEAVFLNFATYGKLDFSGLLLGGIIVGVLGVLDDIAITQAAVVSELYGSAPGISKKEAYGRALRVGKEHAGALVNTLALAYTGAALPLLLLFSASEANFLMTINQEIVATEIIRTIVGSIGLILAIPLTTILAIFALDKYRGKKPKIEHHHH